MVSTSFYRCFLDPKRIEKMYQQVTASREQLFGAILEV